jgi:hypothetical protein
LPLLSTLRKANRRTHLVFNDGSHELHACFGHIPPASKGSVLVAIGESFGAPSNAKYGCVWRMMRFKPRRKPAHDVVPWKPSWMLRKGPLPAP